MKKILKEDESEESKVRKEIWNNIYNEKWNNWNWKEMQKILKEDESEEKWKNNNNDKKTNIIYYWVGTFTAITIKTKLYTWMQ